MDETTVTPAPTRSGETIDATALGLLWALPDLPPIIGFRDYTANPIYEERPSVIAYEDYSSTKAISGNALKFLTGESRLHSSGTTRGQPTSITASQSTLFIVTTIVSVVAALGAFAFAALRYSSASVDGTCGTPLPSVNGYSATDIALPRIILVLCGAGLAACGAMSIEIGVRATGALASAADGSSGDGDGDGEGEGGGTRSGWVPVTDSSVRGETSLTGLATLTKDTMIKAARQFERNGHDRLAELFEIDTAEATRTAAPNAAVDFYACDAPANPSICGPCSSSPLPQGGNPSCSASSCPESESYGTCFRTRNPQWACDSCFLSQLGLEYTAVADSTEAFAGEVEGDESLRLVLTAIPAALLIATGLVGCLAGFTRYAPLATASVCFILVSLPFVLLGAGVGVATSRIIADGCYWHTDPMLGTEPRIAGLFASDNLTRTVAETVNFLGYGTGIDVDLVFSTNTMISFMINFPRRTAFVNDSSHDPAVVNSVVADSLRLYGLQYEFLADAAGLWVIDTAAELQRDYCGPAFKGSVLVWVIFGVALVLAVPFAVASCVAERRFKWTDVDDLYL